MCLCVTLMINILSTYLHHSSYVFEPKPLVTVTHSTDLKSALDE